MLEFRAKRELTDPATLTAIEREQLTVCTVRYFGREMPFETLFADTTRNLEINPEHSWLGFLERWDVFDDEGVHRYDAYVYNVDSGCLFHRGSTALAAQMIQFGFEAAGEADEAPDDLVEDLAEGWAQRPEGSG